MNLRSLTDEQLLKELERRKVVKESNNEKQELIAFWPYDQYPYFLYGTVTQFGRLGRVETKEYGPGTFFKPVLVVPKEVGDIIIVKLDDLKAQKLKAQKDLDNQFIIRLKTEISILYGD